MNIGRTSYCPVCQKNEDKVNPSILRESYVIGIEEGTLKIRYVGLCQSCKFEYTYSNDLSVVEEEMGTISYVVSHVGVKQGYAGATWFGDLSYNKFAAGAAPPADVGCCPACGGRTYELWWEFGDPPMVGEWRGMTWPYGWRPLRVSFRSPLVYGKLTKMVMLRSRGR